MSSYQGVTFGPPGEKLTLRVNTHKIYPWGPISPLGSLFAARVEIETYPTIISYNVKIYNATSGLVCLKKIIHFEKRKKLHTATLAL
jgi:hypothetical protein